MYKVFIREIPLIICNSNQIPRSEKALNTVRFSAEFDWCKLINDLSRSVFVTGNEVDLIWDSFKQNFKEIAAAGGVVGNEKNEILCIFRNGKWDLPKGKVERGEGIEEAAIREVEEECGIGGLLVNNKLKNTYHTYEMNGVRVLKTTHWFSMKTDYNKTLVPQLEEGITKVEWVKSSDLGMIKANTYKSILDLLG